MERMPLPADEPKEVIIKGEEETDPNYGCNPWKRKNLATHIKYGIVNLDKPSGPTSHEVATWVKKILKIEKSGHGGTLDPKVTGVLPIGLGKATRVISEISRAGKEYVSAVKFHKTIKLNQLRWVLNKFTNEIYQRPPLKSAVARRLRIRRIYYIDLLDFIEEDGMVLIRVGCESGTYIRKLCYDMGELLMTGAHMAELRRTRAGKFRENETLVTLQDLNDAYYVYEKEQDDKYLRRIVLPMETAISHMDQITIRDTAVDAICHGADLAANGVLKLHSTIEKGKQVAIVTQKGELVAFGKALQGSRKIAALSSGLVVKTNRVLMPRKTYPYFKSES